MNEQPKYLPPTWMRVIFYAFCVPALVYLIPYLHWLGWIIMIAVVCALVKSFFLGGRPE